MSMQELIAKIAKGPRAAKDLTWDEAKQAMKALIEGDATPAQVGAFLMAMRIKMESGKTFNGRMFVDATYEGDLMARAGATYTVGRDGLSVTSTLSVPDGEAALATTWAVGAACAIVCAAAGMAMKERTKAANKRNSVMRSPRSPPSKRRACRRRDRPSRQSSCRTGRTPQDDPKG